MKHWRLNYGGIYYSPSIAWSREWRKIGIQTNSQVVIDMLNGRGNGVFKVTNLIRNCMELMARD